MGGHGSGGARVGAGGKPKTAEERQLTGWAGKRSSESDKARDRKSLQPLPVLPAPASLGDAQRTVWEELAPHAAAQRTLTADTAFAFERLCSAVAMLRDIEHEIQKDGMTSIRITTDVTSGEQHIEKKQHALFPRHTAMLLRVEAGLTRFRLSPIGKEFVANDEPVDEWAEFDAKPQ